MTRAPAAGGAPPPGPGPATGRRLAASGTVQGVGFRPYVFRAAEELQLTGRVWNDGDGVTVEAFGPPERLAELERRLRQAPPPAARVERLEVTELGGLPPDYPTPLGWPAARYLEVCQLRVSGR